MKTVTIERSKAVNVTFPDGSSLTMTPIGKEWNNMRELVGGSPGQTLIVENWQSIFDGIFGEDETAKHETAVLKASPELCERLEK